MTFRCLPTCLMMLFVLTANARADVIVFSSSLSNTIYSDFQSNSNGQGGASGSEGFRMDAGAVATLGVRRGLIQFDIASFVPSGATINSVSLQLTLSSAPGGAGAANVELHRLQTAWGEGASGSNQGQGAAAQTGDATWINTFFNTGSWTNPGGDFSSTVSASTSVGTTTNTAFTWTSSQMAADVQGWLDNGATNFGWILTNNETTAKSVRGFYTEEWAADAAYRPQLTVDFTTATVPEPSSVVLAGGTMLGIVLARRRKFAGKRSSVAS